MKRTFTFFSVLFLALGFSTTMLAQSNIPVVDKSPMDMSYYPANYPVLKIQDKLNGPLIARVIYSRPKREGRSIFGGLVEFGRVWRVGANEATELEVFKQVKINGKKLAKGRYTLYAITNENSWTMIINKETDTWGHFKYDARKDVIRLDVPVQKISDAVDYLSMTFEKTADGMQLVITWDTVKVALPFTF